VLLIKIIRCNGVDEKKQAPSSQKVGHIASDCSR
jgi:hypothetical protein